MLCIAIHGNWIPAVHAGMTALGLVAISIHLMTRLQFLICIAHCKSHRALLSLCLIVSTVDCSRHKQDDSIPLLPKLDTFCNKLNRFSRYLTHYGQLKVIYGSAISINGTN